MDQDVARFAKSLSPVDIGRILFRRLMEVEPAHAARMLNDTHPGRDSPSPGVGVFFAVGKYEEVGKRSDSSGFDGHNR